MPRSLFQNLLPRARATSRSWNCKAERRRVLAKHRYGFEHICHHQRHSLLAVWLLTCLALTLERLFRVRYLHRGTHPIPQAITLWQRLWLSLSYPITLDTS